MGKLNEGFERLSEVLLLVPYRFRTFPEAVSLLGSYCICFVLEITPFRLNGHFSFLTVYINKVCQAKLCRVSMFRNYRQ